MSLEVNHPLDIVKLHKIWLHLSTQIFISAYNIMSLLPLPLRPLMWIQTCSGYTKSHVSDE